MNSASEPSIPEWCFWALLAAGGLWYFALVAYGLLVIAGASDPWVIPYWMCNGGLALAFAASFSIRRAT